MESSKRMDVDQLNYFDETNHGKAGSSKCFNGNKTSTSGNQVSKANGFADDLRSRDKVQPSTSKDETLQSILSDLPPDVLTGCGPEEAFRPDYRAAIFPVERPKDAPVIERTPSVFHEEEIFDPEDNFYFESDHLALKNNDDYRNMLQTIIMLQAQRTQAIKDLDELLLAKKKALEDPIGYVNKMQTGSLPEYPGPQVIAKIPEIDWTKYNVAQPDGNMRPQTRHAKTAPETTAIKQESGSKKNQSKARVCNEPKPETFNKPWTEEEQRRLEELLHTYPSEEIEMNRWNKIAKALGNRTAKQVSSRVQKYFAKLASRGLPIPGREPKMRSSGKKHKRRHKTNLRKSTFFPYEKMLDDIIRKPVEPVEEQFDENSTSSVPNMDDDGLEQMIPLQEIKGENDDDSDQPEYAHYGYKCYVCGYEPIKGTRFHCQDCTNEEVDLCSSCTLAQHQAEEPIHPFTHQLIRIEPPRCINGHDSDYYLHNFSSNNYMDPNYCPGTISSGISNNKLNRGT